MMRHPLIDLRTIFGPHVADVTRAVLMEHQGELLADLRPTAEKASRAYARSPAALHGARRKRARPPTAAEGSGRASRCEAVGLLRGGAVGRR